MKSLSAKFTSLANSLSTGIVERLLNPVGSPVYIRNTQNKLKQKWTDASNNYRDAPFELSLAEKNYYQYNNGGNAKEGEDTYNVIIFDRFANTAEELKRNSIDKQQEFMADLTQSLKQYQGEKISAKRTVQLLETRQQENADLLKKQEMYNRILQTNERKVVYEINDTSSLYTWRRVMLFLYYSAIVCYIIFGNFIPDKLYVNKTIWLIIVIASLIPIILNLIIKWVFIIGDVLAYWFKERPYKDVLADL
jgi:hypothetical protein